MKLIELHCWVAFVIDKDTHHIYNVLAGPTKANVEEKARNWLYGISLPRNEQCLVKTTIASYREAI